MKLFRTVQEVKEHRIGRESVGLVPTMGAFHEGHLELMRRARSQCETVYVSLFVNPKQFGPEEDLAAYPRDEERDVALAEAQGADVVFAPSVEEVYTGNEKKIVVKGVSERWEGEHRPGHFEGVATVVFRLFDIFVPDRAYFGIKDLQQCAVINKMVSDYNIPTQIVTVETIREDSGLALSSRNAYFEPEDHVKAAFLYKSLLLAAKMVSDDERALCEAVDSTTEVLETAGFEVEYLAFVDPVTMKAATRDSTIKRLVSAVKYRGVRLIDNVSCP